MKMEPIVKIWYDNFKDGKIMGLKCKKCGAVMFPPFPICQECSGMEMEWTEMSGKGTMYSIGYTPMGVPPYNMDPAVTAFVKLDEGMIFSATLKGAKRKDMEKLIEALPLPITLDIQCMDEEEGVYFPRVCLTEENAGLVSGGEG